MSKRITIEEEKEMAIWYPYFTQRQIKLMSGHGWTQVNRTLQPKNIAWLLFHEMQSHDLTKYANKHLQERLWVYKKVFCFLIAWQFLISLVLWFL